MKMRIGTVIGRVDTARRAACLQGRSLLLVDAAEDILVAVDLAEAVAGDRVVLLTGPLAAKFVMEAPVDAAVVAVMGDPG